MTRTRSPCNYQSYGHIWQVRAHVYHKILYINEKSTTFGMCSKVLHILWMYNNIIRDFISSSNICLKCMNASWKNKINLTQFLSKIIAKHGVIGHDDLSRHAGKRARMKMSHTQCIQMFTSVQELLSLFQVGAYFKILLLLLPANSTHSSVFIAPVRSILTYFTPRSITVYREQRALYPHLRFIHVDATYTRFTTELAQLLLLSLLLLLLLLF